MNIKNVKSVIIIISLILMNNYSFSQMKTNRGTDFWIAFPPNNIGMASHLYLYISSENATLGNVSISGLKYSTSFIVTPGVVTKISLPCEAEEFISDNISKNAIHVEAESEISVYALSLKENSTDGYLAIPTKCLGTSYIIASYETLNKPSQLCVVASRDSTIVSITLSANSTSNNAGQTYTKQLQKGELFFTIAPISGDFTGSIITANNPISVFGGNEAAVVPKTCPTENFLVEQIPSISTWGRHFYTVPFALRQSGDIVRIIASEDNSNIIVNGSSLATLFKGKYVDVLLNESSEIISNNPILVVQYARGRFCDRIGDEYSPGDASMMIVSPVEQYYGNCTFTTSTLNGTNYHFVNLIVPSLARGDVKVDGIIVPESKFTEIKSTNFYSAQISVNSGDHTIKSIFPIGVSLYGLGNYDAYSYPGGQSYAPIANVENVVLSQSKSEYYIGSRACVDAFVSDTDGKPLEGIRVDFNVSGTNSNFAYTNSSGIATYCYISDKVGTDDIQAHVGDVWSRFLSIKWIDGIVFSVYQSNSLYCVSDSACFSAHVFNPYSNESIEGIRLKVNVTGIKSIKSEVFTGSNGIATFCYSSNVAGQVNSQMQWGGAGMSVAQFWNYCEPITISQNKSVYNVNEEAYVYGFVKDITGKPLKGYGVGFYVTGTTQLYNLSISDSNGLIKLYYTSEIVGNNEVYAKSGAIKSNVLSQTWKITPNIICGNIDSTSVNCTESGYYPTAVLDRFFSILDEVFNETDKTAFIANGSSQKYYCKDKDFIVDNVNFMGGHFNFGSEKGLFNISISSLLKSSINNDGADFEYLINTILIKNLFEYKKYTIKRNVDHSNGIITVWIEDSNGEKYSMNGKTTYTFDGVLSDDYCQSISSYVNLPYSDYTSSKILEGLCFYDLNADNLLDKTCFKLMKHVECLDKPINCEECIPSFMPEPGLKYVLSAWVKESDWQNKTTFSDACIQLDFRDADTLTSFKASGAIIDGWQRIEKEFTVPITATDIKINLKNNGNTEAYFDDIRVHPFNANMKSFVYNPTTGKLVAELDENNYATFYEYDEEGALVRVKKETERGIKTIQESRNNSVKKDLPIAK